MKIYKYDNSHYDFILTEDEANRLGIGRTIEGQSGINDEYLDELIEISVARCGRDLVRIHGDWDRALRIEVEDGVIV